MRVVTVITTEKCSVFVDEFIIQKQFQKYAKLKVKLSKTNFISLDLGCIYLQFPLIIPTLIPA